ncbi:MAG: helix-turn-helix transcriptional regulator [bacterium]|nr:helix-turn-helix transcriptional regulator [bacterium]
MKKANNKKINKAQNSKKISWYSYDQVFGKASKNKEFKGGYGKEMARIKLAKQIKGIRIEKRLTQQTVAEKADMPQSVIARLESGEHSISLDTLSRIAQVLGKEIELV